MTKAWQSAIELYSCAVAAYSAAGVALTPAEITAGGIILTENADGSFRIQADPTADPFFVRFTPNYGNGVGSAEARFVVTAYANGLATPARWDGGGTWPDVSGTGTIAQPETANWTYLEYPATPSGVGDLDITFTPQVYFDVLATVGYNCSCDGADGFQYRTLLEMRQEMLVGLGRGNQLASPGPGVSALVDMHLRNAQNLLYNRAQWLCAETYFSWPLLQGVRLYGLAQNAEPCSKRINVNKISWAGIVRDSIYFPMRQGIWPALHSYDTVTGYPQRFDIRQCLEVWPAPDITEGSIVIRGNFGLMPLVADADRATIDDYLICQLALGTLKRHFRQPDAADYIQAAEVLLNNLVAGTHTGMARYVPGQRYNSELVYVEPLADPPFPVT